MVRKLSGAGRRCLGNIGAGIVAGTAIAAVALTVVTLLPMTPAVADGCCGGGEAAATDDGDGGGQGGHGGHSGHGGSTEGASADGETAGHASGLLVDLGNKKCPIMGGKPDGKTWSEWNGLRVGHCCGGCTAKFQADPTRALDTKGIEWKAAAEAVAKVNKAQGAERAKALAALKKSHKVLREPAPEAAPQK